MPWDRSGIGETVGLDIHNSFFLFILVTIVFLFVFFRQIIYRDNI